MDFKNADLPSIHPLDKYVVPMKPKNEKILASVKRVGQTLVAKARRAADCLKQVATLHKPVIKNSELIVTRLDSYVGQLGEFTKHLQKAQTTLEYATSQETREVKDLVTEVNEKYRELEQLLNKIDKKKVDPEMKEQLNKTRNDMLKNYDVVKKTITLVESKEIKFLEPVQYSNIKSPGSGEKGLRNLEKEYTLVANRKESIISLAQEISKPEEFAACLAECDKAINHLTQIEPLATALRTHTPAKKTDLKINTGRLQTQVKSAQAELTEIKEGLVVRQQIANELKTLTSLSKTLDKVWDAATLSNQQRVDALDRIKDECGVLSKRLEAIPLTDLPGVLTARGEYQLALNSLQKKIEPGLSLLRDNEGGLIPDGPVVLEANSSKASVEAPISEPPPSMKSIQKGDSVQTNSLAPLCGALGVTLEEIAQASQQFALVFDQSIINTTGVIQDPAGSAVGKEAGKREYLNAGGLSGAMYKEFKIKSVPNIGSGESKFNTDGENTRRILHTHSPNLREVKDLTVAIDEISKAYYGAIKAFVEDPNHGQDTLNLCAVSAAIYGGRFAKAWPKLGPKGHIDPSITQLALCIALARHHRENLDLADKKINLFYFCPDTSWNAFKSRSEEFQKIVKVNQ